MQEGGNVCAKCANQPGIACSPKGEEKWSELPEEYLPSLASGSGVAR